MYRFPILQGRVIARLTKPMIENAITKLLSNDNRSKVLNVVDFGCGVGPTPIALILLVIETVNKICMELKLKDDQLPEIQMHMNDLPSNDFNLLFRNIREMQLPKRNGMPFCFVMGTPGSLYNQLFPKNYLHLVHSNYALHWLSQVPLGIYDEKGNSMNKGGIIVSESSPPNVVKAYRAQFQQDLSSFLKCRSNDVAANGYMIISVSGSPSMVPRHHCSAKLLLQAINSLVLKGLINREKADNFDMPIHYPFKEEMEGIIREEGSFAIEKIETMAENAGEEITSIKERAETIAKCIRAAVEVLVSYHFGKHVWDTLYDELIQATLLHLEKEPLHMFTIIFMLKKNV
ncbi:Caffeine synthase 1 [Bienertia sinuspersici]